MAVKIFILSLYFPLKSRNIKKMKRELEERTNNQIGKLIQIESTLNATNCLRSRNLSI